MSVVVEPARDLDEVRALFRDYAASLGIDLAYQGFAAELETLPGRYAPPGGALLVARSASGEAAGCVGVRPLGRPGVCEMKRLYVQESARGSGAGRALARAAIGAAAAAGHREMVLDTLPDMHAAIGLYRALGFEEVPAYGPSGGLALLYLRKLLPRDGGAGSGGGEPA